MSRRLGSTRDLVLVGAGHAHALVLVQLARRPLRGVRVTLVSDGPQAIYSGMVPGFVSGQYEPDALAIELGALCARAGARFVEARALRVAAPARTIELEGGALLPYDVASLDVGSTVAGLHLPGVARHALATRPAATLVAGVPALLAAARGAGGFRAVVVGAGPGGVELACALRARFVREGIRHASVSILESSLCVLPGAPRSVSKRVSRCCRALGIGIETGVRVAAVEPGRLVLDDGAERPFDGLLWCTGAAALPLGRDSRLPLDERGFVRVEPSLQVLGHPSLFAAGDVASLSSWPTAPKAGVYAVRAAPVLAHNLRASFAGEALRAFRPQRDFLTLLNTGGGSALGWKWGVTWEGRLVFRLKDWIDRRFVAGLRPDPARRGPQS